MLKNVLSLLLSKFYSKKESELVGHQAMPELNQYIDLTSNATTNVENTYVAPTDGYFVCATKGGEWSGVNVWGTLDVGVPGASGIQGKVFTPCVKGASVHYIIYGTIHLVRFYKTIGGGYQTLKKLILQGGGLCCLKHSYSSLRRSSWLARRSGWLISRLIFLRPLQKLPSLLTENATPSQCLTRASWFCNVTASCLQDLTDLTWSISEREQTATSAFLFIPRKATLFLTRLANPTTSEPQTCTSIRLTVANNLSIGGVSC